MTPTHDFVVDVDDVGRATLRFGDGDYGQQPSPASTVADVTYRIGNGRSGNIGADGTRAHRLPTGAADLARRLRCATRSRRRTASIAETIEEVRQLRSGGLPGHAVSRRHRGRLPKSRRSRSTGVAGAVASFRWTGSWYTVFVGIDPVDPDNVVTDLHGVPHLEPTFKQSVFDRPHRYRLAGYDLEIRAARYVPLDLTIQICASSWAIFRGDVAQAVAMVLSSGVMPGGKYGLFDPAEPHVRPAGLSQPHLRGDRAGRRRRIGGRHHVPAPRSRPRRRARAAAGSPIGPWEIARLDNDPQQHGERRADIDGGRRLVSADCGCCVTVAPAIPAEIGNRPGLSAIAYRIGTFATFREAILDELSHTPELSDLARARQRRLHRHRDRVVVGGRGRAHVLPRSASPTRRSCAPRHCATRCCAWFGSSTTSCAPGAAATTRSRSRSMRARPP